jgi:hypothetical protein
MRIHYIRHQAHSDDAKVAFERPHIVILSLPRSGTHFLESSLASHPRIHARGECFKRYLTWIDGDRSKLGSYRFCNKPNCINTAVIMYSKLGQFEAVCGSIFSFKVIHLIRRPRDVALSVVQMEEDKRHLGIRFKPHHSIHDPQQPCASFAQNRVSIVEESVRRCQGTVASMLTSHQQLLTVSYDDLTGNKQVNALSDSACNLLLGFLGLEFYPLRNHLRKTKSGYLPLVDSKS